MQFIDLRKAELGAGFTVGRGIAHTEDSLQGERLHAAQLWIALPHEHADIEPAFEHYAELPRLAARRTIILL